MTKRIKKNFEKRFGDPPRINITPVTARPDDQRYHGKKIANAYEQVLSGILKRPVTKEELFGLKSSRKCARQTSKLVKRTPKTAFNA